MVGQCRKSPFCACAACALDREGGYMQVDISFLTEPPRAYTDYLNSNRSNIKVVGGSTKQCVFCGCTDFVLLRSINIKSCADCKAEIHWPLTEGQKPLL
jgi:hypothetical protein